MNAKIFLVQENKLLSSTNCQALMEVSKSSSIVFTLILRLSYELIFQPLYYLKMTLGNQLYELRGFWKKHSFFSKNITEVYEIILWDKVTFSLAGCNRILDTKFNRKTVGRISAPFHLHSQPGLLVKNTACTPTMDVLISYDSSTFTLTCWTWIFIHIKSILLNIFT